MGYAEADGDVTYMAKINLAFRLRNVQSGISLKLALADIFAVKDVSDYLGEYYTASGPTMKPAHVNYPVVISQLEHKVVFGDLTKTAGNLIVNKWIFVPYSHVPSYTDPRA